MFCSKNNFSPTYKSESDSPNTIQVTHTHKIDKMVSIALPLHSWSAVNDMAVIRDIPEDVLKRVEIAFSKLDEDKVAVDEVDDPHQIKRTSDVEFEKVFFETMKYEVNRKDSFSDKWPLQYINPKELAETGLFYLQSEDKVQCAFCHVIIDDWNVGDKPLREHIKKSPKCPFLMTTNVGNVPVIPNTSTTNVKSIKAGQSLSYKPKHPRMADIRNRLATYRSWPLIMFSSKQLAECGLYYTGVADVVTCFFCGGSLGNWELNDDPWTEHHKFFPDCGYLGLAKRHLKLKSDDKKFPNLNKVPAAPTVPKTNLRSSLANEVILQACEVFPKSLVTEVEQRRIKMQLRPFTSLQEICEAVLEYKNQDMSETNSFKNSPPEEPSLQIEGAGLPTAGSSMTAQSGLLKDVLLCKICMDQERGVVFQPCGHLVSCTRCAQQLFNCPLCRTPITGKVRSFLS